VFDRRWFSIAETASRLGVSQRTIRRGLAAGSIPGARVGSRIWRVDLPSFEEALDRQAQERRRRVQS